MEKMSEKLNMYKKDDLNTILIKEFEEALKNEKFKEFVGHFKSSKEILSKYTSSLEECMVEYNHCKNCKGLAMCKNKVTGYAFLPKETDKILEFNYLACKYTNKKKKDNKYLKNIESFDIPKEIKEAKMKDIYLDSEERFETIEWLNNFVKEYQKKKTSKGLYLYGNFGCGKTYLIAAMFNELAKKGYKSAIIFWPEFLRNLKTSFTTDFKEKFEHIKKVPLLLIDDIGAENTTAWGRDEIFCPLIQYRMQENLPTFFTSNFDLKALEEHFSFTKDSVEKVKARRIIERINQLSETKEMISKNLRK